MAFNERYTRNDNQSTYVSALKDKEPVVPSSRFNFSRPHFGQMNIGTVEILDCFPTYPRSKYDLGLDISLKSFSPLNRRIFNNMRLYVKAFQMDLNDLWEAAQNHIDHGRSGLLDIDKPYFDGYATANGTPRIDWFTPNSVANQLGVPVRRFSRTSNPSSYKTNLTAYRPVDINDNNTVVEQDFNAKVNALPFAMYQRIYIDELANKNLIQDDRTVIPENVANVRIPYSVQRMIYLSGTTNRNSTSWVHDFSQSHIDYVQAPNSSAYTLYNGPNFVYIGQKRYAQKRGDYFTTASPFADLLRGDVPVIDFGTANSSIDFSDSFINSTMSHETSNASIDFNTEIVNLGARVGLDAFGYNPSGQALSGDAIKEQLITALNKAKVTTNFQTAVTANNLRTLMALTILRERNALTNGDYTELIKAQFGSRPKVNNFKPKYIGGFYQDLVFSDVTNTTAGNSSPLGVQAGQSMLAGSGNLGTYHSDDFGYIMIIAYLVPDEYYNQGLPRWLGELSADEEYISPILNNLPPQAIKNKELFLTTDEAINEDLFAYTQRYEHMKARDGYISGFVGMKHSEFEESSAFVMHHRFNSVPFFNAHFVSLSPDNIDMDVFASKTEPPYIFNAFTRCSKVEPLPYDAIPADFGIK